MVTVWGALFFKPYSGAEQRKPSLPSWAWESGGREENAFCKTPASVDGTSDPGDRPAF